MAVTTTYSLQLLGNASVLSLNGTTGGYSTNPETIAIDDYVVTAIDDAYTGIFPNGQITVRTFDSGGVNTGIDYLNGSDPSMTRLRDKTFGVVGTTPDGTVAFWKFPAFGSSGVPVQTVIGTGSNPDVAASELNLRYAVAWEVPLDNGYSNIAIHIGLGNGSTSFIVKLGSFYDHNPSVAYVGNDNIVIAWDRTSASGNSAIWYTVLDDQGNTVTAATQYDASGFRNIEPSVAASGNGFTIAYEDSETGESQVAIFNRSSDGRNVSYTRVGTSSGPDSEVSTADLGGRPTPCPTRIVSSTAARCGSAIST